MPMRPSTAGAPLRWPSARMRPETSGCPALMPSAGRQLNWVAPGDRRKTSKHSEFHHRTAQVPSFGRNIGE